MGDRRLMGKPDPSQAATGLSVVVVVPSGAAEDGDALCERLRALASALAPGDELVVGDSGLPVGVRRWLRRAGHRVVPSSLAAGDAAARLAPALHTSAEREAGTRPARAQRRAGRERRARDDGPGVPLVLSGQFFSHRSMGKVSCNLLRALRSLGYVVYGLGHGDEVGRELVDELPLRQGVVEESCLLLYEPIHGRGSRYLAAVDVIDSFHVSRADIAKQSRLDAFFALSEFSCREFIRRGVPSEVVKPLQLGVDTRVYRPTDSSIDIGPLTTWENAPPPSPRAFRFLHGGFLQERKGTLDLLDAYLAEFTATDDVELVIKAVHDAWGRDLKALVAERCERPSAPRVAYLNGVLCEHDLVRLYSSANCVVQPSRLEGYGLVPLEAMACGVPCIITDYSGPRDYAHAGNALLVPCREEPAVSSIGDEIPNGITWAVPEQGALRNAMRRVASDAGLRAELRRSGLVTARAFSWERAAMQLVTGLGERGIRIRRRGRPARGHVTIAVPVYNGKDDLERLAESLRSRTTHADYDVVVLDDGSTDGTEALVHHLAAGWPELTVLGARDHGAAPIGVPAAKNILAASARGEWLCYLDCDIEITQTDWLEALIDTYIDGISAPKLLFPDGRIQSAGGMLEANGLPMRHRGQGEPDCPQYDVPREVVYAPGACHFLRTELLRHVRWNEAIERTYFDDGDFCYRARALGEHIWYRPEATLVHHQGSFQRAAGEATIS